MKKYTLKLKYYNIFIRLPEWAKRVRYVGQCFHMNTHRQSHTKQHTNSSTAQTVLCSTPLLNVLHHCSMFYTTAQCSTPPLLNVLHHCSMFYTTAQCSTPLLNVLHHCSMFYTTPQCSTHFIPYKYWQQCSNKTIVFKYHTHRLTESDINMNTSLFHNM